jgi:hypothetical protein
LLDEACTADTLPETRPETRFPAVIRLVARRLVLMGLPVPGAAMAKAESAQAMGPAFIADSTWFKTWENTGKLLKTACADLPDLELPSTV